MVQWWSNLDFTTQILLILAILAILPVVWGIWEKLIKPLIHRRSKKPPGVPFPYELTSVDELASKVRGLPRQLEEYVERESLKKDLGKLLTRKSKVIIHGPSEVGKSREAIEIIRRLSKLGARNIYMPRESVEVPSYFPPNLPSSNIVLFIDNFAARWPITSQPERKAERGKDFPTLAQRLEETVRIFEEAPGTVTKIDVILTTHTEDLLNLQKESKGSKFLKEFEVIKLEEMSLREKCHYIDKLANRFGFTAVDDQVKQKLAEVSGESLTTLYEFFKDLYYAGKKQINEEDVNEFIKRQQAGWRREVYWGRLKDDERKVFDALSNLRQFEVFPHYDLLIKICVQSIKGLRKVLARRKLRTAIKSLLEYEYIRRVDGRLQCHDSKLLLKELDDPDRKTDLGLVSNIVQPFAKQRKYQKDMYFSLHSLAREWYEYEEYKRAIGLNNQILSINSQDADAYFHKGLCYYNLDKSYWKQAKQCYIDSLAFNPRNLFVKHALSTLYRQWGNFSEALKKLDEITDSNDKDLLAHKSKLEILSEIDINSKEAIKAYRKILLLLKDGESLVKTSISAELACVRFSEKIGEDFRDRGYKDRAEKRFRQTVKKYESLIKRIPVEEKELGAIVRNSYGCFLYDTLGQTDKAIEELGEAYEIWPMHEHTLHKLGVIYLDEADIQLEEERRNYDEKAKKYLEELLALNPYHYAAKQTRAKLEGESIPWANVEADRYWQRVSDIYKMYQEAFEPESTPTSLHTVLHNAKTHHVAGSFLWHIEAVAHKRNLIESKPSNIPLAGAEFERSIEVENRFPEHLSPVVLSHLILAYSTLGSYKITIARGDQALFDEGTRLLARALILSQQSKREFVYYSHNSFVESFVGKLFLSIGGKKEAKRHLEVAVKSYDKNWRAWWFLGRVNEQEDKLGETWKCFEKSAEGQQSSRLFAQIRGIITKKIDEKKLSWEQGKVLRLRYSEKAFKLNPNHWKNCGDYGEDLLVNNRFGPALPILNSGKMIIERIEGLDEIDKRKRVSWFLQEIGYCYRGLYAYPRASEYWRRSAEVEDSAVGYLYLTGRLFFELPYSDYQECARAWEEFVKQVPYASDSEKQKICSLLPKRVTEVVESYRNLGEEDKAIQASEWADNFLRSER